MGVTVSRAGSAINCPVRGENFVRSMAQDEYHEGDDVRSRLASSINRVVDALVPARGKT
jgi:hypothetical protein